MTALSNPFRHREARQRRGDPLSRAGLLRVARNDGKLNERVRDLREDVDEVQPQRLKRDDAGNRDQARDQPVFDCCRAAIVLEGFEDTRDRPSFS